MERKSENKSLWKKFPPQFWLVVMFEFFERGSYYGMMSILSVYLTNNLNFAKESVGLIKGVIQPLLYFLPIISGALADRFGYRRTLMVAFSLLGTGYFLTAQATEYSLVFGALVIMGLGAGTFKPIISGTIARITDKANSTLGFGIYYWSINLGAFLFPLILVPFLKKMDPGYVILAAAVGTATMLIPTFLFFKDPVKENERDKKNNTNLIQTLANAFEIIYSPIVILFHGMKRSNIGKIIFYPLIIILFVYSLTTYLAPPQAEAKYPEVGVKAESQTLLITVKRNLSIPGNYSVVNRKEDSVLAIIVYNPDKIDEFGSDILAKLQTYDSSLSLTLNDIKKYMALSEKKITVRLAVDDKMRHDFKLHNENPTTFMLTVNRLDKYDEIKKDILYSMTAFPVLKGMNEKKLDTLVSKAGERSFFLLYVTMIIMIGLIIVFYSSRKQQTQKNRASYSGAITFFVLAGLSIWILPDITVLGRIIAFTIYLSLSSLFIIDKNNNTKFKDHAKFLLMIFLYSGFWIMYFQMFDSVLWYVQAYVNAESLNKVVNTFLGYLGININWFFDVEHVTVINAGTIILLQLAISSMVKHTKAMPTMITGITLATVGMAILAISADIWVFLLGITLFSIGEMTTHPKFISYIGLIAPPDKKAMYMGYLFLYGVFGSSIGGILGAKLYVHFVDNLNQPQTLWLIFSLIGVATIVSLLLYNKFLAPKHQEN